MHQHTTQKKVLRYKDKLPYQKASPLRISTISAVSFLNAEINFRKMFERLPLLSKDVESTGVFSMKFYDKDEETKKIVRSIRYSDANGETTESMEVEKYFQNQITIIWTFMSSKGEKRVTNGFMFTNGKIKGVGLKCDEDIRLSFQALCDYLQTQLDTLGDAMTLLTDEQNATNETPVTGMQNSHITPTLNLHGTRATMYNTDFSTHFQIIRDELFRVIIEEYALEESEFEPDIYPAVKIKFAWNTDYIHSKHKEEEHTPGVCYCESRCNGKGCGSGDGQCKVVTVCVFGNDAPERHGGKIIITGANQYQQVKDVYAFMNALLEKHYDSIVYREPYMSVVNE